MDRRRVANAGAKARGPSPSSRIAPVARRTVAVPLLIAVATLALSACGSSGGGGGGGGGAIAGSLAQPGLYGKLPSAGTPTNGGTITFGQLSGSTPDFIVPIVPSADSSTTTFQWIYQMYLPLYNTQTYGSRPGIFYDQSVANKPTFSDGNLTITIPLKHGLKWSDGKPVTAQDFLFDIALIKAAVKENAANWGAYTPGTFPDVLKSIQASDPYTVVMHLSKAFNPSFFLYNVLGVQLAPLPSSDWNIASPGGPHLDWNDPANAKKIWDFLNKQASALGTYGSNPLWKVVDGPFVLSSWSPVTSSWTLTANPSYTGAAKPRIHAVQGVTYTGVTPMLNAMLSGSLDVASVDFSQLASVPNLKSNGYSVFGLPSFGWAGPVWNFKDKAGHFDKIVAQLYFRQAMMMLQDEPAIIRGIYHGAAGLAYGPVSAVPTSAFVPSNAVKPSYPYDPAKAVALLKAHGWHVVPNGQTTCQNAGSGPSQCGAGIPAGTPLSFTWATQTAASGPYVSLTDEAITSAAKQYAGINIHLFQKTFNYISTNYNDADPSMAKFNNDWGVENYSGFVDNPYPTQHNIFDTTGSYNSGGYSDPQADALIRASVYSSDPNAVTKEAYYLGQTLPALWGANYDYIWAVSKRIGGTPGSLLALTQYTFWPQYLFIKK
jgi:peptide/nickel transport system substrate-binding protein